MFDGDSFFSVSDLRNYFLDDPLLDWLDLFGEKKGYEKDPAEMAVYHDLLRKKGRAFEEKVYSALGVSPESLNNKDFSKQFERVKKLLDDGMDVIAQATLIDYDHGIWGIADLIVSKEWFVKKYPLTKDLLSDFEGYLVGEIKFKRATNRENGFSFKRKPLLLYSSQLKIYFDALSALVPVFSKGFILARDPPPVSMNGFVGTPVFIDFPDELDEKINEGIRWLNTLRERGGEMELGCCSEMYPNMKNKEDFPWHKAKKQIAEELDELTRITNISLLHRKKLHARGVYTGKELADRLFKQNDDSVLSVFSSRNGPQFKAISAVLKVNYLEDSFLIPALSVENSCVRSVNAEFFVDFESFDNVNDDFSSFPGIGGTPMVYMIGCGDVIDGEWVFKCFVAKKETHEEEEKIFQQFYDYLISRTKKANSSLKEAKIFHWASHERRETKKAAKRHNHPEWLNLPWIDLNKIVKKHTIAVKGAFDFKLKSIAKALYNQKQISSSWEEGGLSDGLTAMAVSWNAYEEAERNNIPVEQTEIMKAVIKYNEIDCKTTYEILEWIRSFFR